jgi:hypothetical protein
MVRTLDTDNVSESSYLNKSQKSNTENAQKVNNHWLWGNWVILSLMAAIVWAACNLFIGELAELGVGGIFYFNTGSLFFTGGYFIRRCC